MEAIRSWAAAAVISAIGFGTSSCTASSSPEAAALVPTYGIQDHGRWAPDPFTRIIAALPLKGGGLIVADLREGGLFRLDPAGNRGEAFGSRGQGPGELVDVGGLLPAHGDTFAVVDGRQRRLIFFSGDGEAVDQVAFPGDLRSGPWGLVGDRLLARAPLIGRGDEGFLLPLLAWSWREDRIDTLTTLRHRPFRTWETGTDGGWYDRVSFEGERIGRVLVPEGHRLLLVDEPGVYTVQEDDLGLQWIHRGSFGPLAP